MSSLESYYRDHWVTIEPDRLSRYDEMFRLDDKRWRRTPLLEH